MAHSSASQLMRMVLSYLALLLVTLCAIYPVSSMLITGSQPELHSATSFLPWLGQSSLVVLGVAITGVALSSSIGYALSRRRFLRRNSTITGALLAQLLPTALFLLPIFCVLFWLGLIDSYLALVIIYLVTVFPFCLWQMKSHYDMIPLALEEAAEIEGASPWQTFSRIVLPLALRALAITALFSFLLALNEYVIAADAVRDSRIFSGPPRMIGPSIGLHPATGLFVSIPAVLLFLVLSLLLLRPAFQTCARRGSNAQPTASEAVTLSS